MTASTSSQPAMDKQCPNAYHHTNALASAAQKNGRFKVQSRADTLVEEPNEEVALEE
ncbi:hypothetical protein PtB15_2B860 [Puccinia triticina]|nr:hypothetical protein PtB15_2B860 [Puccinia triticina]